ncbi:MAG: CotH kinase family protein [bacterium]|nr:CotH kinase family protein [bacterium]
MITHKHITKAVCVLTAAAVIVCILAMIFSRELTEAVGGTAVTLGYEQALLDTGEVIRIDIKMDQTEWDSMLANASAEEYVSCDVTINDGTVCNVGIRPKGNTSLSAIAADPDTDRFSLKLEFDHYVEGQTYLGLDKLVLNNNYADATNMKEAVVYDMYRYLGADASLCTYAELSVNGEYWGVYLALEAVEDSFLLRNYGAERGSLYKPEGVGGTQGEDGGMQRQGGFRGQDTLQLPEGFEGFQGQDTPEQPEGLEGFQGQDTPQLPEGFSRDRGNMRGGQDGARGFSMSGGGADLVYTDDDLDSYSVIWEGQVTETGEADHRRVVNALKKSSEGADPEEYMDVDNVLKYMAVHVFAVNQDSLSGNMAHNYYLYEYDGKLNILPWDYNLSFGGMNAGAAADASGVINDAIDDPFQGTDFFDALLENEVYRARYHEYLRVLAEEYVFGGKFEETYNRIRAQIDELTAADPTAFYSYEEYEAGAEMLYRTVLLRAESIRGQLDGSIPSTDAGQRADASGLIDASFIDIGTMGTFGMGGRNAGFSGREGDGMQEGQRFGFLRGERGDFGVQKGEPGNMDVPAGAFPGNGNAPGRVEGGSVSRTLSGYAICLLAVAAALIMAKRYKRVRG